MLQYHLLDFGHFHHKIILHPFQNIRSLAFVKYKTNIRSLAFIKYNRNFIKTSDVIFGTEESHVSLE